MNTRALWLALLISLPALADDPRPWPQKGDTAFVPAEVAGPRRTALLGTVPDIVVVPACTPMEIGKIVKEDKIVLEDDSGDVAFPICGDWRKWVRATRKECRDLAASQSVSFRLNKSLRASKYCYVVVTEDHAVTPAPGAPPP